MDKYWIERATIMHSRFSAMRHSAKRHAASIAAVGLLGACAFAQHFACAGGLAAEPSSGGASASGQEAKGGLGFSIESEMLTYRALESNSAAVGCDVAAFLSGTEVNFAEGPTGSNCQVKAGTGTSQSVIITPFASAAFEDFRLWRVEMELMHELRDRAAPLCPEAGRGLATTAAKSAIAAVVPGGSAFMPMVQSLLGSLSAPPGSTPVVGTIQDQAFMDGVARELRRLNVTVVMPSAYTPFLLSAPASKESPFISGLVKLLDLRSCLVRQPANGPDPGNISRMVGEIDGYVGALQGFSVAGTRGAESPAARGSQDSIGRNASEGSAVTTSSPDILKSVLAGDGLAQELGVDAATGLLAIDESSPHILLVRALESGGTVASTGGLFSSKTQFSGGSVGTFALFNLDGEVECSGNVYEYGGSIASSTFGRDVRAYKPEPSDQYIFQQGSCRRPVKH
jgi:hypothetical protein